MCIRDCTLVDKHASGRKACKLKPTLVSYGSIVPCVRAIDSIANAIGHQLNCPSAKEEGPVSVPVRATYGQKDVFFFFRMKPAEYGAQSHARALTAWS